MVNTKPMEPTKRSSFVETPMGRMEVREGSEDRVRQILAMYQRANSNVVQITRAPNYIGRNHTENGGAAKRSK